MLIEMLNFLVDADRQIEVVAQSAREYFTIEKIMQ